MANHHLPPEARPYGNPPYAGHDFGFLTGTPGDRVTSWLTTTPTTSLAGSTQKSVGAVTPVGSCVTSKSS